MTTLVDKLTRSFIIYMFLFFFHLLWVCFRSSSNVERGSVCVWRGMAVKSNLSFGPMVISWDLFLTYLLYKVIGAYGDLDVRIHVFPFLNFVLL